MQHTIVLLPNSAIAICRGTFPKPIGFLYCSNLELRGHDDWSKVNQQHSPTSDSFHGDLQTILLMEEMLHRMGCIEPCKICKHWYIYHINWWRISSINSSSATFITIRSPRIMITAQYDAPSAKDRFKWISVAFSRKEFLNLIPEARSNRNLVYLVRFLLVGAEASWSQN